MNNRQGETIVEIDVAYSAPRSSTGISSSRAFPFSNHELYSEIQSYRRYAELVSLETEHVRGCVVVLSHTVCRVRACIMQRRERAMGPDREIYLLRRRTADPNVFTQLSSHRHPHASPSHLSSLLPPRFSSRAATFSPFTLYLRRRICMECIHMKSTILPSTSPLAWPSFLSFPLSHYPSYIPLRCCCLRALFAQRGKSH